MWRPLLLVRPLSAEFGTKEDDRLTVVALPYVGIKSGLKDDLLCRLPLSGRQQMAPLVGSTTPNTLMPGHLAPSDIHAPPGGSVWNYGGRPVDGVTD